MGSRLTIAELSSLSWATNAGTILEPALALKQTGWSASKRPAARKMNWLFNQLFAEKHRQRFSNYFRFTSQVSAKLIYHPGLGSYFLFQGSDGRVYTSAKGDIWFSKSLYGGTKALYGGGRCAISSGFILFPKVDGWIGYSADGVSWSEVNTGLGYSYTYCIETNYLTKGAAPDRIIVGGGPSLRYCGSPPSGAWYSPTTAPAFTLCCGIRHRSDYEWYAFDGRGRAAKTMDGGINWTHLSNEPYPLFTASPNKLGQDADINMDTGTICVVGGHLDVSPTTAIIARSTSWGADPFAAAAISAGAAYAPTFINTVQHLGKGWWIAAEGAFPYRVYNSYDDGATWEPANMMSGQGSAGPVEIACNGTDILIGTNGTELLRTLGG